MTRAVGIDLGTTNSVVSILEGGEPVVVVNSEGARTTPSVVAFTTEGDVLVGDVAKRQAVTNVNRTVRSVKRHMGSDWNQKIDENNFTAQEISAFVLRKLKEDAEAHLGEKITQAVITVPAYFSDAQRQATKEAGEIAGLEVSRILNEPTAAALAYGLDRSSEDETILVFDLGGGTFDVSLLKVTVEEDGFTTLQVKATAGDNQLGGDDWDVALAQYLLEKLHTQHPDVELHLDATARQRLLEAAETAKISLSSAPLTTILLPYLTSTEEGPIHFEYKMTRVEFEEITRELLERCRAPFHSVIAQAGTAIQNIDHVVLVGGSTRMPAVTTLIKNLTNGREPNRGVNPDEVVAVGAGLQAGVLTGAKKDILLIDVMSLSIGIETRGGIMTPILERNTAIPVRRSQVFTTSADNQPSVLVNVYQGERPIASDNTLLGNFKLTGIPPAARGIPQIEVAFDVDANGLVHVSAKDLATGKQQRMTVSGTSALSDTEIDRMLQVAQTYADKDRARAEFIQEWNEAERLIYMVKNFLEQNTTIEEQQVELLNDACTRLEKAATSNDVITLRVAQNNLNNLIQATTAAMYADIDPDNVTEQPVQEVFDVAQLDAQGIGENTISIPPKSFDTLNNIEDNVENDEVLDELDKILEVSPFNINPNSQPAPPQIDYDQTDEQIVDVDDDTNVDIFLQDNYVTTLRDTPASPTSPNETVPTKMTLLTETETDDDNEGDTEGEETKPVALSYDAETTKSWFYTAPKTDPLFGPIVLEEPNENNTGTYTELLKGEHAEKENHTTSNSEIKNSPATDTNEHELDLTNDDDLDHYLDTIIKD